MSANEALNSFLAAIAELDYDSIPGGVDDLVGDRSWMRQYCSEYGTHKTMYNILQLIHTSQGFYQRGDPTNPLSIETSFRSLERFQQQCNSAFPTKLPPAPQVEHINKYGGWLMNVSNVFFTNGECTSIIRYSPCLWMC